MLWKLSKLLLFLFVLVVFAALLSRAGGRATTGISQPIAFNHLVHLKKAELDCDFCHRYVKEEEYAGCPPLEICAACHESPQTESADEAKVVEYVRSGQSIPWRRLYDVPDHVYYSHRRHVTVAKIDCTACHGPIGESPSPPEKPLNMITMEFCVRCHEERKVSVDCNGCHR